MTDDERAAKLRRDAIKAARRLAHACSLLAAQLSESSTNFPRATDLLGMSDLHELIDACAKLRLLRDLYRDGK